MLKFIAAAIALAGLGTAAGAQGMSLGEFEFRNSCSQCHGTDGKGVGALADFLSTVPADLTMLQKDNGGVFPVERIYNVIDGTADLRAHGARDMPIWGVRYLNRVQRNGDFAFTEHEATIYARTRILALIEYLTTIQAE